MQAGYNKNISFEELKTNRINVLHNNATQFGKAMIGLKAS